LGLFIPIFINITSGNNIVVNNDGLNNYTVSTLTNPQFYNIQCSSTGTHNTLVGTSSGLNIGSGSSSNTLIGYNDLF
jgi:hypothetical protein